MINRFFLLLSLALLALAITASATASCKSEERLVHEISRPGPHGGEKQLNRALAIARLVATIHERLESAGVCYFATGRTLEGVWRHAASMPHHAHSVDLAIESVNFDTARQVCLNNSNPIFNLPFAICHLPFIAPKYFEIDISYQS
jgi:hypothetical protein